MIYRLSIFQTQGKPLRRFCNRGIVCGLLPPRSAWFFAAFPEKVLRDPVVFLKNPVKGGLPRFAMLPDLPAWRHAPIRARIFQRLPQWGFLRIPPQRAAIRLPERLSPPQAAPPLPSSTSGANRPRIPVRVKRFLKRQRNQRERIIYKGRYQPPRSCGQHFFRRGDMGRVLLYSCLIRIASSISIPACPQ